MRVTIAQVAERCAVSVATVSRAFTSPELVRDGTRERVLRVAGELGYRPNRAARGLITGRTGNIGIVLADLANPFYPPIVKAAQARARQSDHSVFLADTDEDPDVEAELIRVMAKQVDGVVLCSSRMTDRQLREIATGIPMTLINRKVSGMPAVLIDSADGMRQAVEHLRALGHRRAAYLAGPLESWSDRERHRGVRTAGRVSGVEVVDLGPFPPRFEAGMQAADLALAAGVTAVLAYDDLIALGVLSRLADRGVGVPDDCSVIGFDDIPLAAMCTPSLTTVSSPKERAGRTAIDLLLDSLDDRDGERPATQRRLPTQLIVRASTAPPDERLSRRRRR